MYRKLFYHTTGKIAPPPLKWDKHILQEIGPRFTVRLDVIKDGIRVSVRYIPETRLTVLSKATILPWLQCDDMTFKLIAHAMIKDFLLELGYSSDEGLGPIVDLIWDMRCELVESATLTAPKDSNIHVGVINRQTEG